MKKRLLSGLVGFLFLVTSVTPGFVSYAESDIPIEESENEESPNEEASDKDTEDKEEKEKETEAEKAAEGDTEEDDDVTDPYSEDQITVSNVQTNTSSNKVSLSGSLEEKSSSIIKSITLYKVVNGERIQLKGDGTDVISSGDVISAKYEFESPLVIVPDDNQYADISYNVVAGHEYSIPGVPAYGVRTSGDTITVKNGGVVLGNATFSEDGSAKFTVDSSFTEPQNAEDAYFFYDFEVNFDGIDNGGKEEFELSIGDTKVPVKIADFMPKGPKVEKASSDVDENGDITWTVTVTNNGKPIEYENGYSFTDSFSDGQTFVDGSFKINGSSSADTEVAVSGNTVSWNYKDNTAGAVTTFTYKTHVDFLALTKDTNESRTVKKDISNKISVTAEDETYGNLSESASAKTSASRNIDEWTAKTGTDVDPVTGEATWTVTIRNNGFNLSNVVLHDQISVDSSTKITVKDISVVDQNGNAVSYKYVKGEKGAESQFVFGDMAGDAVYTVTYKTKIEDFEKYLKTNHEIPKNKAWMTYEYTPTGVGPAVAVVGPGVDKPFTGIHSKAAIEKTAGEVNTKDHTMTWKVTANKSAQPLKKVTITDTLPKGHEFVRIEDVKVGDSSFTIADDKISVDTTNGTVTVDFGDALDGKAASFTIVTKLDDTQNNVWANNKTVTYENEVTMNSYGNDPVSDSVSKAYKSTVLEKKATSYDYSTQTIQYTLTVNKNGMEMNKVTVSDVLDDRLELAGDVDVSGDVSGFSDKTKGNNLELYFEKIGGPVTIKITVKLKEGEQFSSTGNFTISNKASITSAEYPESVQTAPVNTTIKNTVLAKEGSAGEDGRVSYTVRVNQAKQTLYTGNTKEVKIKDVLGASFVLDTTSVKLYIGEVTKDGKISATTEITGVETKVTSEGGKTILEVVIPKAQDGNAFVLKYSADVVDLSANDLSNSASLVGYGSADNNQATHSFKQSQFSNVSFSKYTYLIAELRDKVDEKVLEGGEFKLIDADTTEVVGEKITGKNGQITFVGNLTDGKDYILVETKAPEGYVIPDELKEGKGIRVTAVGKGLTTAKNNAEIVYNEKIGSDDSDIGSTESTESDSSETGSTEATNGSGSNTGNGSNNNGSGNNNNNSGSGSGNNSGQASGNNNNASDYSGTGSQSTDSAAVADPNGNSDLDLPEVLGVYLGDETADDGYIPLGGRNAGTGDEANPFARAAVIIIALAVATALIISMRKEKK